MSGTLQALRDAGDRPLAGQSPFDTFASYGLTLEDAAIWASRWVRELADRAQQIGQDPRTDDFRVRVALGCLAIGIEHGKSTAGAEAQQQGEQAR